jgi:MFS family permease
MTGTADPQAADTEPPDDQGPDPTRLYRRTLAVVAASQVFGGAGFAAGVTVASLLAADLLGSDRFAGLPTVLFTAGSAITAFVVGRISQRYGRRPGLTLGFAVGSAGAAGIVIATAVHSVLLLLPSLLLYGAGTATALQARYAASDLARPAQRGTAVSVALVATTLGAVAGPNLVSPMGAVASGLGLDPLAGPFLLATAAYGMAAAVLFALLRPDPLVLARGLAALRPETAGAAVSERDRRRAVLGATVMVVTQLAMVAVMTMTPLHMAREGNTLVAIGVVIGLHIGAMYLPSLGTGLLVDRIGRLPVAAASGVVLALAGVVAAIAPEDTPAVLAVALVLLGLGWNLGLISGTALLVDGTAVQDRARVQGSVDVLVALAAMAGGGLSGFVVDGFGYPVLTLATGVVALLLVPAAVLGRTARVSTT